MAPSGPGRYARTSPVGGVSCWMLPARIVQVEDGDLLVECALRIRLARETMPNTTALR